MPNIAVQMDAPDVIDVASDTTFALMVEAQSRDLPLHVFQPTSVAITNGIVSAICQRAKVDPDSKTPIELGDPAQKNLAEFSTILIRQNPPFDMAYFANTHLLEQLPPSIQLLNNPRAIRNTPEKLSALHFAHLMPPTLIARDKQIIEDYSKQFPQVVLKPLSMFGGQMIFKTSADDPDFSNHVEELLRFSNEPIIAQKFLKNVAHTDKRVMILKGEVVGVLGRIPPKGQFVANLHAGGKAVVSTLTAKETEVCREVGAKLQEWDIFFAGLDLIDERLTEINVTSPTLIIELRELGGPDIAKLYWDEALKF